VATIRALKYHGGASLKELDKSDPEAVKIGLANLDKHLDNLKHFNFRPVVAINKFTSDTPEEIAVITEHLDSLKIRYALNDAWAQGGEGALELAEIVAKTADACTSCFHPLYEFEWSIEKKIETVAKKLYGAADVEYSLQARKDLKTISDLGLDKLPVCIAKTQKSLSDKPSLRNRPEGFIVNIREIEIAAGAGFVVPIAGSIMRMPGLPEVPSSELIDIDNEGNISGLF